MPYFIIGLCIILIVVCIVITLIKKAITSKMDEEVIAISSTKQEIMQQKQEKFAIKMEMLPISTISDESKLVEIKNSKILAHVNNLVPELAQVGVNANNIAQAVQAKSEVLYRAILPAGAKLTESKAIDGAFRGMWHNAEGIGGHANLVVAGAGDGMAIASNAAATAMGVASMVVGQYYMTQINDKLQEIGDNISKISDFQNNEYRSKVFSLLAHIKKISDFQVEIIENSELRFSKISQIDSLEVECTQLLGQANLTLAGYTDKNNLDYSSYEAELKEAHEWYEYQQSLLDLLHKISELRYTLHLGAVSREQCIAIFNTYQQQVIETQTRLTNWHNDNAERLNIDTDEVRRKRSGFNSLVYSIPSLFNENLKFKSINEITVNIINVQTSSYDSSCELDNSNLYTEDVQLISKDGKIYYFPESEE